MKSSAKTGCARDCPDHQVPPSALLQDVSATVRAFCQHADQSDDVTVTVTRFGA